MDFSMTDEQRLLNESVRRLLRDQYAFDQRRTILSSTAGYSRAVWQEFGALGLLGLNVPETDGGLGAGAVETMLVAAALGECLVVEPYLASAVVATRAIARLGSPAQRAAWLPGMSTGERIAVLTSDGGPELEAAEPVRAVVTGGSWQLQGRVSLVYHASAADLLLVPACTDSTKGAPDSLFAVAAGAAGVRLEPCVSVDGQPAAAIEFSGVQVDPADRIGASIGPELAAIADFGLMALCAETLGALDRCLALTVDYTRTRHQFGGPIGRFQALQHRMVDMLVRIEQTRSLVYLAAARCEDAEVALRESALSAAKVVASETARFVGQQAVQMHGGMGVSDEVAISHYFKRLTAAEIRLGSAEAHLARYCRHLS